MKSNRFRRTSGIRVAELGLCRGDGPGAGSLQLRLRGRRLPAHIRTIYIEPFTNETPQFDLDQKLYAAMLDELPRRLGVRVAGEQAADAIVRGVVSYYDDAAQAYNPASPDQP
jgi:hypothetical protein